MMIEYFPYWQNTGVVIVSRINPIILDVPLNLIVVEKCL